MNQTTPPPAPPPPELLGAWALLEAGDFRRARRELARERAAHPAASPELGAALDDLEHRLKGDPRVLWLGLGALALLAFIAGAFVF